MIESHGPIGNLIPGLPVTIVGGGISGLLMGYYLKKRNIKVQILEKEKIVGGKIGTVKNQFGLAEKAANAIFPNDDVIDLLEELNIPYYQADRKLKKYVWRQGFPHSPPIKKREILKVLLSLLKKIPYQENFTVKEFFQPLLGETVCDEVLAPALGGIYAHDISELHFESIFKDVDFQNSYLSFLLQIKNKRKSSKNKATSVSFKEGMQSFIDKLRSELIDEISTDSKLLELPQTNLIICTNAHEAAEILSHRFPKISEELNKITYKDVSTSTMITSKKISFLDSSFGILFPPKSQEFNSLGVLSNSEIYPFRTENSSDHSYTFIVKGSEDIEDRIKNDLNRMNEAKSFEELKVIETKSWEKGIPLYNLERYKAILKIRSEFVTVPKGVVLFGNYIDGISIRELVSMSKSFSNNFANESF